MSRTHLVVPDQHAHPDHSNHRADLLAQLMCDIRPDVVINIGDAADMPSLSSYDKGKRSFQGRSYKKDIEAHLEFQERMWGPVKRRKKKLPYTIILEGNHEHRIEKALDLSPELSGSIGFNDYDFDYYYDTVVRYSGNLPGILTVDGIQYAHYFSSGLMGYPISGEHVGYSLLTKRMVSATQGHSHILDYCSRNNGNHTRIHGLVAGGFIDYESSWAGQSQNSWWQGVVLKKHVENGNYDPQFISLKQLQEAYGNGH